jgi:ABC-2 type transport system ATP-binding protein
MRLLCGALRVDSGSILLAGRDLAQETEQARAAIGYLPQRFSLYEELTVLENLRFFAEVRGVARRDWASRAQEILEFVDLDAYRHRRAGALSGGMKQKLGLAAALVHSPAILLLDEPTGGVDAVTRQAFWQLIIQLLHKGVAALVSTPYMDEAARASKVGFMLDGQIWLEGSPGEIMGHHEGHLLAVSGEPRRLLTAIARADPQVVSVQIFGDRLHLTVAPGQHRRVRARLRRAVKAKGGSIASIQLIEPDLEDVFLALMTGWEAER